MTKKIETQEIADLREKRAAAIAHHRKLDDTLAKVTAKVERLEQDMAKHVFGCKDAEKQFESAERKYLRDEITKKEFEEITKKQDDSAKTLREADRSIQVARRVIEDLNKEIREAMNKRDAAKQRLSTALRKEMIAHLPENICRQLLGIYASYQSTGWTEPHWRGMLHEVFPEPNRDEIEAARAEFNKSLDRE